jgi:hypothetical protein
VFPGSAPQEKALASGLDGLNSSPHTYGSIRPVSHSISELHGVLLFAVGETFRVLGGVHGRGAYTLLSPPCFSVVLKSFLDFLGIPAAILRFRCPIEASSALGLNLVTIRLVLGLELELCRSWAEEHVTTTC